MSPAVAIMQPLRLLYPCCFCSNQERIRSNFFPAPSQLESGRDQCSIEFSANYKADWSHKPTGRKYFPPISFSFLPGLVTTSRIRSREWPGSDFRQKKNQLENGGDQYSSEFPSSQRATGVKKKTSSYFLYFSSFFYMVSSPCTPPYWSPIHFCCNFFILFDRVEFAQTTPPDPARGVAWILLDADLAMRCSFDLWK